MLAKWRTRKQTSLDAQCHRTSDYFIDTDDPPVSVEDKENQCAVLCGTSPINDPEMSQSASPSAVESMVWLVSELEDWSDQRCC
jgi:hypothetical protein